MTTSTADQIEQIEAKLPGLIAAVARRNASAQAFRKSDVDEAENQMRQFIRAHGWPSTLAPQPEVKRQLEDRLQDVGDQYFALCELMEDEEYPLKRAREELEELQTKMHQEQYAERERHERQEPPQRALALDHGLVLRGLVPGRKDLDESPEDGGEPGSQQRPRRLPERTQSANY